MLDWKYFPHIFDVIYDNLDAEGLGVVGLTCSDLRARVETSLWERITLSQNTLMSTENGIAQPQAILYGQTLLVSTRYRSALPDAFVSGHPHVTKAVYVHHNVTVHDSNHCDGVDRSLDGRCPTASRLRDILSSSSVEVVHFCGHEADDCQPIGLVCEDLSGLCINSLPAEGEDVPYIMLLAHRHLLSFGYPPDVSFGRLQLGAPWVSWYSVIRNSCEVTILLRPEKHSDPQDQPTARLPEPGVQQIIEIVAEELRGKYTATFVAVDRWPPTAPPSRRRATPDTSRPAFERALNALRESWELRPDDPDSRHALANIHVIDWDQLRERVGDVACDLLVAE